MPRYDYQCPQCNSLFEYEHGMREHPEVLCPTCGFVAQRVFSSSGIVLKGSGFYNTDQRGKKGATKATSSHDSSDASSTKSEPKSKSSDSTTSTNGASSGNSSSNPTKTESGSSE